MRKAKLIIGAVLLVAALVLANSMHPPVTLTVRALTNDSRVAEVYAGSNFQSVVAIIEMKNHSKREFTYRAYYPCPRMPYFKCLYREAGAWQEDALDTASTRAFVECPAAITGQPWGPWTLRPSETIAFRADILRPKAECMIAVDYWVQGQRKQWYDCLPGWIVKRLPWARDRFQAETRPLSNGSDS